MERLEENTINGHKTEQTGRGNESQLQTFNALKGEPSSVKSDHENRQKIQIQIRKQ